MHVNVNVNVNVSQNAEYGTNGMYTVCTCNSWTDEDIYHLCYELRTRTAAIDIATCSALTASPSTSQHWNALGQLKRVMNVTVSDCSIILSYVLSYSVDHAMWCYVKPYLISCD